MKQILPILAAWLHDIGRFAQRANAPCSEREQEYCPGGTSNRHVLYTDYFIEHTLPLPAELEGERSQLARLASAYLKPNTEEEKALQQADLLASGGEQGDALAKDKNARLASIFTNVRLNGKGLAKDAAPLRYDLYPVDATLAGSSPLFPCAKASAASYEGLFKAFVAELGKSDILPLNLGLRSYLASLVSLLEKYTWCIPFSSDKAGADISLYDHAASTAAIVQALLGCTEKKKRFLLCSGEISGLQQFVFGSDVEAEKGSSNLLSARALYLQALSRSVWLALLDALELTNAAKIMDAGGRFILLLPDTPSTRESLTALQTEIELGFLRTFQGAVRVSFATIDLEPEELEHSRFHACYDRLNDALDAAKLKPLAKALQDGIAAVFSEDYTDYSTYGECACCHMRPATGYADKKPVCDICSALIEQVGKQLPSAHYLVFSREGQGIELASSLTLRLEKNCANEALFKEALDVVNIRGYDGFSYAPIAGYIPQVSSAEFDRWQAEGRIKKIDGKDMLGRDAIELNAPKTFAMLAEEALVPVQNRKSFRSVACLAACKANVDNLGLLFDLGFDLDKHGESLFSMSRFAMLSRMLNQFFAVHVPQLMQREFPNMYLIFAGGDDLFALGPWSETVLFALRLQEDFARFTGNNPAVTFSAGLFVFKPNLPMHALQQAVYDALDAAKSSGKNAATLFGVTADWQQFRSLHETGQWLEDLCLSGAVSQGFVRRLLGYARECRDFVGGNIRAGLYLSHLAYDVKRNWKGEKSSAKDLERLNTLGQDKNTFPKAEVSISWALYRTRTGR